MITHLHFTGKVHLWHLKPEVSNLQITIKMIFSDGQETLPKLRLHCPSRLPVSTEPTPFQITVISSPHPSCLVLLPKTPLVQLILTASKYFPFNHQVLTIQRPLAVSCFLKLECMSALHSYTHMLAHSLHKPSRLKNLNKPSSRICKQVQISKTQTACSFNLKLRSCSIIAWRCFVDISSKRRTFHVQSDVRPNCHKRNLFQATFPPRMIYL